jgi:hypothetical protein
VPTNEQKSDLLGGNLKTSPWMYFQPDSSSSKAAAHSNKHSTAQHSTQHAQMPFEVKGLTRATHATTAAMTTRCHTLAGHKALLEIKGSGSSSTKRPTIQEYTNRTQ